MDNIKIYKTDSENARLANKRLRIVYDRSAERPDKMMDLVFTFTRDEEEVPNDAIYTWDWYDNSDGTTYHFYTTEDRCREMVVEDSSYWSEEKLEKFEEEERSLFEDWASGKVFGYVIEHWDEAQRKFVLEDSLWGMYGVDDLLDNIEDEIEGEDIVVCLDKTIGYVNGLEAID